MERKLGRLLSEEEVVHHEDEDKTNNDPENLVLFPNQKAHAHYHRLQDAACHDTTMIEKVRQAAADPKAKLTDLGISEPTIRKICRMYGIFWKRADKADLTEDQVRETLQGRTTEEAAALLDVHPQTLYNRFDHLLDKRNAPGFLDEHREELCKIAKLQGVSAAADMFGTNRKTLYEAFERWGVRDCLEYQGKRDLLSRKDEVLALIQEHGYAKATELLGKSKNALREAVKRWSEQGDLPDEFAHLASPRKSRKLQPERTASSPETQLL
jgi:transposase